MKTINKTAFGIFEKIAELLGNQDSTKINNAEGVFMPLSVERTGTIKDGQLISLAHYYEQNGDLMADPEMVFLYKPGVFAYPISYKLDGLGIYRESVIIEDDKSSKYYPALQTDQAAFANQWLKNIKGQQGL